MECKIFFFVAELARLRCQNMKHHDTQPMTQPSNSWRWLYYLEKTSEVAEWKPALGILRTSMLPPFPRDRFGQLGNSKSSKLRSGLCWLMQGDWGVLVCRFGWFQHFRYLKQRNPHLYKLACKSCMGNPTPKIALYLQYLYFWYLKLLMIISDVMKEDKIRLMKKILPNATQRM